MKRIFLAVPLLFSLVSCWDYTELNMQNYVLGMSIDYISNQYEVKIETVKITGEPTSLSSSEGAVFVSRGDTVFDAVRNVITKAGKKLYWGHTEIIFISEEIARNHLHVVTDVISRSQDIYSNVNLVVVKDLPAGEILSTDTFENVMISTRISNILRNEEPSRRFVQCELWQLQKNEDYTLMPTVFAGDSPKIEGSAIFTDKKLVGFLNGEETQLVSLLKNPSEGGFLPHITYDQVVLSFEILRTNTMIKNDTCRVDMTVSLANSSSPFDVTNTNRRETAEKMIETMIEEKILELKGRYYDVLPHLNYDVHVSINSSGLVKR